MTAVGTSQIGVASEQSEESLALIADKVQITFLNSITGMNPTAKDKRPILQGKMG
jgi:hypothetical protein